MKRTVSAESEVDSAAAAGNRTDAEKLRGKRRVHHRPRVESVATLEGGVAEQKPETGHRGQLAAS